VSVSAIQGRIIFVICDIGPQVAIRCIVNVKPKGYQESCQLNNSEEHSKYAGNMKVIASQESFSIKQINSRHCVLCDEGEARLFDGGDG
jgi:hypothetical protein